MARTTASTPATAMSALAIRDLTDNKGVDICIELTGVYPGLSTAISSVRFNGTICSAGFYQGEAHSLFLGREWHMNNLTDDRAKWLRRLA